MAQAAFRHDVEPRTISFKATLQTLDAFQPLIDFQGQRSGDFRVNLYTQLLDAIARHRVGDRPDRYEPRYRKRIHKQYCTLKIPRHEAKLAMSKGRSII